MIQIQSSWFPLYDWTPQTFVTNIFFAAPQDYAKAVQRIYHVTSASSFIDLPVGSYAVTVTPIWEDPLCGAAFYITNLLLVGDGPLSSINAR